MSKTIHALLIVLIGVCAFIACSQEEPIEVGSLTEDVRSRGAAEQDSTKNDSTYHDVTVNTDWDGETYVNF